MEREKKLVWSDPRKILLQVLQKPERIIHSEKNETPEIDLTDNEK